MLLLDMMSIKKGTNYIICEQEQFLYQDMLFFTKKVFPFKNHVVDEQPLFNDTVVGLFETGNAEENDRPTETYNNATHNI